MVQKLEYNGYTNYETWNCALWLDNEEYTQSQMSDKADELVEEIDPHNANDVECIGREMATFIEAIVDELYEMEPEPKGMFGDMLKAAMCEIDYRDIAENQLADALYNAKKEKVA